jgi:2-oxoisovalerate dehydrogenase E2 component (dihydrolipoyl transacylase)
MDFRLPELGEGVYEAEMTRWLVRVGDAIVPGQALLEVLTDKATMEVPSPFSGVIASLAATPGEALKIGQVILAYDEAATPTAAKTMPAAPAAPSRDNGKKLAKETSPAAAPLATAVKAAPSVRQRAREQGIDLAGIVGSGPDGRILIGDLAAPPAAAAPSSEFGRAGSRVKLQGLRRKIAEHMVQSTRSIPHFTYVDECDVSDLVRTRESLRALYGQKDVKLTFLAFFVKAVALALREVPIVNASLDEQAEEIVMHDAYHVGIAVATPAGLIVPVIRNADQKSLLDIAREIQKLSDEARAGKSRLEDLRGGTFTVTSIGGIGGLFASPIIHQPQVGIIGIGKIVQRPVFDRRGQVVPADMVFLSFSFDHRVLDGSAAVTFGNAVIKYLQKPLELALAAS